MHAYSVPESRVATHGLIGVVAIALAWALFPLTSWTPWPEWLAGAPSALGLYALLYLLYDRVLWRSKAARWLHLSWVTDVSGRYEGELVSTYKPDGVNVSRSITIDITQTWTHIEVAMSIATGSRGFRNDDGHGGHPLRPSPRMSRDPRLPPGRTGRPTAPPPNR